MTFIKVLGTINFRGLMDQAFAGFEPTSETPTPEYNSYVAQCK